MLKKQQSFSKENRGGILYLVPTPIGNLEDMTLRAIRILSEVDEIASEDTRNTLKLLNHFQIKTPQISLHQHNVHQRIPQLLEKLAQGKNIAQVSDAGMPSISDPGHELVCACVEKGISVVSLPGATAGMTALVASGLSSQPFLFYGFLPRKKKEQRQMLEAMKQLRETQIFYESPYRVKETLSTILEVYGNRAVVLCRELTKIHEEYLRGTAEEVIDALQKTPAKGEICLLVAGFSGEVECNDSLAWKDLSPKEQVEQVMQENGGSSKSAIREVALLRGMKKSEVYAAYHEL